MQLLVQLSVRVLGFSCILQVTFLIVNTLYDTCQRIQRRPTEKSMCVLRHLVGYLSGHSDLCMSLKWDGRCSGVYHQQYNYDAGESVT